MNALASTFLCLESILSSSKFHQDLDLYSSDSSANNVRNLRNFRDDCLSNYGSSIEALQIFLSRLDTLSKLYCESAFVEKEFVRQRLHNQRLRAEKRLKELVFEIFGEYAKTKIRVVRRKQFLQLDQNMKIALNVWKLRWRRFCLKLSSDLFYSCGFKKIKDFNVVQCSFLCAEDNAEELESLVGKLNKKVGLFSVERFDIVAVAKVMFLGNSDSRVHLSTQNIQFAQSADDLNSFFSTIQLWLSKISNTSINTEFRTASTTQRSNLLSTSALEWLHIPSLNPQYWEYSNERETRKGVNVAVDTFTDQAILSSFTDVYSQQHSSSLFNSRVYFCLEDSFFWKYKSLLKGCVEELEELSEILSLLKV